MRHEHNAILDHINTFADLLVFNFINAFFSITSVVFNNFCGNS